MTSRQVGQSRGRASPGDRAGLTVSLTLESPTQCRGQKGTPAGIFGKLPPFPLGSPLGERELPTKAIVLYNFGGKEIDFIWGIFL